MTEAPPSFVKCAEDLGGRVIQRRSSDVTVCVAVSICRPGDFKNRHICRFAFKDRKSAGSFQRSIIDGEKPWIFDGWQIAETSIDLVGLTEDDEGGGTPNDSQPGLWKSNLSEEDV